ncbi:MAG: 1-acyl-sn-glycerol-3-phosphate acyltransferase [Lachnospiraceae bacterium]|nr:1-acyl-sn-glycerol-3-phosphate acyltransferase [Lachnospiraceae bacterium]
MFILSIICSWFIDRNKEYTEDSPFYRFLLYTCTKIVVLAARIRIHVRGLENVPEKGRYLLVGNHKSNFDPILAWEVLGKEADLCFLSKPENFKKPAFGKIAHRCCFLAIDRDNPRKALKTIDKAATFMKEDKFSIGVYPEGTRNRSDDLLLPFHTGLFKIAKKAEAPILVCITKNNEKIVKHFPFKGTDVYYDFCGVIPAEEVVKTSNIDLGEKVREMMTDALLDKSEEGYEKLKDIKKRRASGQ